MTRSRLPFHLSSSPTATRGRRVARSARALTAASLLLAACARTEPPELQVTSSALRATDSPVAAPPAKTPAPKAPTPSAPPASTASATGIVTGATVSATTSAPVTTTVATTAVGSGLNGSVTATITVPPVFTIKSLGGKCLDFGAATEGAPVSLQDCNGGASQQVLVEEVNARHEVVLHAGNQIIGVRQPPVGAPPAAATPGAATPSTAAALGSTGVISATTAYFANTPGTPLVLLDSDDVLQTGATTFALDGDSIIYTGDREQVVQPQNNRGANGTAIVLGPRQLADAEFWTLSPIWGSMKPTSGFVSVSADNFASALAAAGPGSVLEVDPGALIPIPQTLYVPGGVTIRGGRRGLTPGAKLWSDGAAPTGLLDVRERDVRITGLRLRGPSSDTDSDGVDARAIIVHAQAGNLIVDHDELSMWTTAGVWVQEDQTPSTCDLSDVTRPLAVRVFRSYIHDNAMQDAGYGVCVNDGGTALVLGNTFVGNRHCIKAGGEPHTQYRGWYNLVLSYAPVQTVLDVPVWHTQDFDVHGTGDNGFGGTGGQYFEIAGNTFLGTDRPNFELRGVSCQQPNFHDNVSLEDLNTALSLKDCDGCSIRNPSPQQFEHNDPTGRFGVGDFDGDWRQDLFLATGAAWYYAPAGQTEWRFLNAQTDGLGDLLFGDFDGDGRTDVFAIHSGSWVVSWGGASAWDVVNSADVPLDHLAAGNFVGDRRDDIFYADGQSWRVSSGASEPFQLFDTSSFLVHDLRFGDFNHDGKTDVFGIANGSASVTYAGIVNWSALPIGWMESIDSVVVADFNGDGTADVAMSWSQNNQAPFTWSISYGGTEPWVDVATSDVPLTQATAIGAFDDNPGADVTFWAPTPRFQNPSMTLQLVSGAAGVAVPFGLWMR